MNNYMKKPVLAAMLTALGVVLALLIRFPIVSSLPFLEYDPADIPVLLCSFALGPVYGLASTVAVSLLQGLTVSGASGLYGILMHIIATATFVIVSGFVYRKKRTLGGAILSLALGVLSMTAVMIPANLLITPAFMGTTASVVWTMMPGIVLFNFAKGGINAVVTFFLYKPLKRLAKL